MPFTQIRCNCPEGVVKLMRVLLCCVVFAPVEYSGYQNSFKIFLFLTKQQIIAEEIKKSRIRISC